MSKHTSHTRLPHLIPAIFLTISFCCFACAERNGADRPIAEMTPDEAREKLKERGRDWGEYPFLFAVRDRDAIAVRLYLQAGMSPDVVDTKRILPGVSRPTPVLMYAVNIAEPDIALALIAAGANVRIKGQSEETPLMTAATRGEPRLVRALLDAGADPNARVGRNMTVLIHGVLGGSADPEEALADLLTNAAAGLSGGASRRMAAFRGPPEILTMLIEAGAEIDAQTAHGETALMYAAQAGLIEKAKVLLAHGADTSLKNMNGDTALTLAKKAKHPEMIQLLEQTGAVK